MLAKRNDHRRRVRIAARSHPCSDAGRGQRVCPAWPTGNASPPEAALKGVHASIRKTHERLQADSPDGSQVSRVLSFFGTKGGVGTTLSR